MAGLHFDTPVRSTSSPTLCDSPLYDPRLSNPFESPSPLPEPERDLFDAALSQNDGKTSECNRKHTFDDFIPADKLAEDDQEAKKIGATWDVIRAVGKFKKPLQKLKTKNNDKRKSTMSIRSMKSIRKRDSGIGGMDVDGNKLL